MPKLFPEYLEVELPAIEQLQALGYTYLSGEALDPERDSYKNPVLTERLRAAIQRLNPWLDAGNLEAVVRHFTQARAEGLLEVNEALYDDLTTGITVQQDRGDGRGKRSYTVQIIDWGDRPGQNEFLVVNQFRIMGTNMPAFYENDYPDLVVFVNGLPLVVIECKSPTLKHPIEEAIKQLQRYQLESPRLFYTNQFLVTLSRHTARTAALGAKPHHFTAWTESYRPDPAELAAQLGHPPNPQEMLLAGIFTRANLLDLVRNFVVFEHAGNQTIKKVARYQQFRAVNEAVRRALEAVGKERSGTTWHTQGAGKSLTMVWTGFKLRTAPELQNPTILVVTDRRDLRKQLHDTFVRAGFPSPLKPKNIPELKRLLEQGGPLTIFANIQMFQDDPDMVARDPNGPRFPVMITSPNVYVLVDEAHRTNYKTLATNMRTALPNAVFWGYTGTPIEKGEKRSTTGKFGPYIDRYDMRRSELDKATVPIHYEARLPEIAVEGRNLDDLFEFYFSDKTEEQRAKIKQSITEADILSADKRVKDICFDIVKHYAAKRYAEDGFKAQVVTHDRPTAVKYYNELRSLIGDEHVAIIISSGHNDPPELKACHTTQKRQEELIENFKDRSHPLRFLVVNNMLLQGFDAPVEQVMYIDRSLREHTLLQAIARVNRTAEGKTHGLIVDYYGMTSNLEEALAIFDDLDAEMVMQDVSRELPRLAERHAEVMAFFRGVNRADWDACLNVIEPEDVRAEFEIAFHRFAQSLDIVMPDPAANLYRGDMEWLGELRDRATQRFYEPDLGLVDVGAKIRKLIDDHILSQGITHLSEPVPILSDNFEAWVQRQGSDQAQVQTTEHALRKEIEVRLARDPIYYESLRARLEAIVASLREKRIVSANGLLELLKLRQEMKRREEEGQRELPLTPKQLPFFNQLAVAVGGAGAGEGGTVRLPEARAIYTADLPAAQKEQLVKLTEAVWETISEAAVIDWQRRSEAERQMVVRVKDVLRGSGLFTTLKDIRVAAQQLVDLAKEHFK